MKKSLKNGLLALGVFAAFMFQINYANAVECKLVKINPDRVTAVYDCDGKLVTVVRPVTVR